MNNKNQENGTLRGPLIFTVPAYGFVMALYLDWLDGTNRAAISTRQRTAKDIASRMMNKGGEPDELIKR